MTFETAVLPYRPELLRFALRLARNRNDAHDVVQQTMLNALTSWHRFQAGTNVRAWLYTILRNAFVTMRRRTRFEVPLPASLPEPVAADPERGPVVADIIAAERALTAQQREVLDMLFARGLTHREVAAALDVPLGTVQSAAHRAVGKLRASAAVRAAYGLEAV